MSSNSCDSSCECEVDLGRIRIGTTKRILLRFKKDGVDWTGIDSVSLRFEKPDRETTFDRSMTVYDDSLGQWYYDTTTSDLDEAGFWTLDPTVTDGSVVDKPDAEIGFEVVE